MQALYHGHFSEFGNAREDETGTLVPEGSRAVTITSGRLLVNRCFWSDTRSMKTNISGQVCKNPKAEEDDLLESLEALQYEVEQMDYAQDLYKIGGTAPVIALLEHDSPEVS